MVAAALSWGYKGEPADVPVDATPSASLAEKPFTTLAIVVEHEDYGVRRCVEDELTKALLLKGYTVPTRSDVDNIRRELSIQATGLTDESAAKIGQFLNVPVILLATVYEDLRAISARLVHVETIEVLWVARTGQEGQAFLNDQALRLGAAFPSLKQPADLLTNVNTGATSKSYEAFASSGLGAVVVQIDPYGFKTLSAREIEDEAIYAALRKGYSILARTDLGRVLEELETQHSGLTDEDATEMGKMRNAPAVLLFTRTLTQSKETNTELNGRRVYSTTVGMSARLLHVESGQLLWVGTLYRRKRDTEREVKLDDLLEMAGTIVQQLLPAGPYMPVAAGAAAGRTQ